MTLSTSSFILAFLSLNCLVENYAPDIHFFSTEDPHDLKKLGCSLIFATLTGSVLYGYYKCKTNAKNNNKRNRSISLLTRVEDAMNSEHHTTITMGTT